ncbi:Tfp pilus assembly protein PilE [Pseudomonas sp. W4I3]|nr:Tfp pilus assembly protein PilE [Pseudomonas sp. W4I3]
MWQGKTSHQCAECLTLIELLLTLALTAMFSTVAYPLTSLMSKCARKIRPQRSLRETRRVLYASQQFVSPAWAYSQCAYRMPSKQHT